MGASDGSGVSQDNRWMHLKQVHMENFKSFGRKLTVPFEPGFTGITGPNGSGKSNIGDAILFVLGPNSPRAIRAGRLTDLIFNGGQAGTPAKSTLVSLTFDNSKREMPVDADDVVLTRKVKRMPKKGDKDAYSSYFYVNGRASKKREFVDLLNHARISADGYNITQQGDILEICNMGDGKRRQIVDGIAGVTTFDKDIDQANKRRDEVEENLERIGIVLEEIERNLKQLDREKDAAQKYRDLQESIGRTKAMKALRRKDDLEAQVAQVQQQIDKYTEAQAEHEDKLRQLRDQIKEVQLQMAEVEQEIREQGGEEVEKIQEQTKAARDRMSRAEERILFLKEELAGGDEDLLPVREALRKAQKELDNTKKIRADAEQTHADKAAELAAKKKARDGARDAVSQSNEGAMAINRELGLLKKEHEDKRIALHDERLKADRFGTAAEEAEKRLAVAQGDLDQNETSRKEVAWEIEELEKETGGSGKQRKEAERRLFELRKAEAELRGEHEDLENRIRRFGRELSDLQAQEQAAARHSGGAGRAVDEILKARNEGAIKGIIGTLGELASVDDQYQTALETAAGANINAIVVEDDGVAAQCLEMLKRTRAGRAKMLPLNKVVSGRPRGQALMKVKKDGCIGFALDLIDFDQRYHGAFWQAVGDTLVVNNMDAGRRLMGGVRMVSLDGELFEAGGAMVGGSRGKKSQSSFSSGDRRAMDDLIGKISQAEDAQRGVEERLGRLKTEMAELDAKLSDMGRGSSDAEGRLETLKERSKRLDREHQTFSEVATKESKAVEEARQQNAAAIEAVEALEARLAELEQERESKAQLMLKGSKKELRDQVEQLEAIVRDLTEEVVQLEGRKDVAVKQEQLIEERKAELQAQIDGSGTDREELQARLENQKKARDKARAEVEALDKMERKATAQLGGLRDKKDKLFEKHTTLKAKAEKIGDRIETHQGLVISARSKLPGLEESLGEALIELKQHPIELAEDEEIPPFDELRRMLRDLEGKLDRLGPVNMRALEEFEAQAERKSELDAEVDRLKKQREELIALVAEITERKKGVFMEVFEAINENFADVYGGLSMGGKALMELENPDDPFEGGLILKAQPMGKRVTRLNALSGGEKSLTSMAFIFAIQRYDPSPFYYFDEVDQNLDAVNSELLAKMIKDNARFAQFIQVSLRKITLKEANFLYGVTQQVPGQSEVIANFDLNDLQEPEEEDKAEPGKGLNEEIESMLEVKAAA